MLKSFYKKATFEITNINTCIHTYITIQPSPSRFTQEARSVFYVTRPVFTVSGAWRVTVTTVDTGIATSYPK